MGARIVLLADGGVRAVEVAARVALHQKDTTHRSKRTMAARAGIAPSSVHKIWVAHGRKQHLASAQPGLPMKKAVAGR